MEKAMKTYNYKDFKNIEVGNDAMIMVYIKWSGTSQLMKPIVENIASKYYEKMHFYAVEVTDPTDIIITDLRIHFFPTFLFRKEGELVSLLSGTFSGEDIEEKVKDFVDTLK